MGHSEDLLSFLVQRIEDDGESEDEMDGDENVDGLRVSDFIIWRIWGIPAGS